MFYESNLISKGKAIIISGPSGSGKTTVVKYLLQKFPELMFSISATSRKKRDNEVDGKDYYFISLQDFKKKIENNEFIEYEEVYPNVYYGTLKSEVERIFSLGKVIVFDVDVKGAINLKNFFKDNCISIFIKPPSFKILEERLMLRKTETKETLQIRLKRALEELSYEKNFDFSVLNNNLKDTLDYVENIVRIFIKSK